MEQATKDNVQFISLQFTDLLGTVKEIIIPIEELKDAAKNGVWFDGSSIEGFARIQESDLFLKPDLSTYSLIPWLTENGKTARFICDIYGADGKPFELDPRYILRKTVEEAGYDFKVGPELEFYLFKDGNPIDSGGYFDMSSHQGYKVVKEIITALKSFGIPVETSHHEVGGGQYEIDFRYGSALKIADKLLTLKYVVKKIAQMHELQATFMPKPIAGKPGSGMHVHQSLYIGAENKFLDVNNKYGLSELAFSFIAGQMKHVKAMCALLCPTVNSYKRLVSGFEAPVYITWAGQNRSALVRVPRWLKEKPDSARMELRNPDASCNPYLAFAVMLKAGLDGINNKLQPPMPVEENVYQFDSELLVQKNIDTLPNSLAEALNHMAKCDLIKDLLGENLFKTYITIKRKEWGEFKQQVTSWEVKKYLDSS